MGSTYSVAKTTRAVRGDDGNIYYALIESTFESNVFPRTPRASCIFFGTLTDCMSRVLRYASACEGGMLKGASGCILPESYIRQWRRALSAAIIRLDETARVRFGDGIYVVANEKRSTFKTVFEKHGHAFDEKADESSFSVRACAPAIAELVRDHGVYPWRLIEPEPFGLPRSNPDASLSAVFPRKPTVPAITAQAWRLPKGRPDGNGNDGGDDDHLLVLGTQTRATGWRYSTIADFITEVVVPAERQFPGCAESLIRRFRPQVVNAPRLSPSTAVRLHRPTHEADSRWRIEQFDKLLGTLRADASPVLFAWNEAGQTLETTLGDIERLATGRVLQGIQSDGFGIEILTLVPAFDGEKEAEEEGAHALART